MGGAGVMEHYEEQYEELKKSFRLLMMSFDDAVCDEIPPVARLLYVIQAFREASEETIIRMVRESISL